MTVTQRTGADVVPGLSTYPVTGAYTYMLEYPVGVPAPWDGVLNLFCYPTSGACIAIVVVPMECLLVRVTPTEEVIPYHVVVPDGVRFRLSYGERRRRTISCRGTADARVQVPNWTKTV